MHERHQLDHQEADNRKAGITSVSLSRDKVSRLKPDCAALISLADGLEALAGDIRTSRRADQAHHLVTCLRSDVTGHLDAEAAVLGGAG